MKAIVLVSSLSLWLLCAACNKPDGPLEKAGQRVDEAIDNVKDGESPLHKKGAGEKAGEAVDKAVDKVTK